MTTTVSLTAQQTDQVLQQAQLAAQAIANSATTLVGSKQFVFFAAFDGTDNAYVPVNGDTQNTAIAQLYDQVSLNQTDGGGIQARYYAGVGTPGTLPASSWFPPTVTTQSITTAQQAYNDFAQAAFTWLQANPDGSVTSMIAGFSRGSAAEAIFAQMLYENGLVFNGQTLIPPGTIGAVSAALVIDPVLTFESGNMDFPPGVQNLTVVRAENEYRSEFTAADYGVDNDTIINVPGDHSDAGDAYDNGLGGIYLGAYTSFFQNSGLNILPVLSTRQFISETATPIVIHSEVTLLPPYEISLYNPTNDLTVTRETTSYGTPVIIDVKATTFTAYNGDIVIGGNGYNINTETTNATVWVLLPGSSAFVTDLGSATESIKLSQRDIIYLSSNLNLASTIFQFLASNTIDVPGIPVASGAFNATDILTVSGGGNTSVSLQLDPAGDYSTESFLLAPDGTGGTDVVAESDSGTISFTSTTETLLVVHPANFTGTIFGFQPGDTIDLVGIVATDATLTASALTVQEIGGALSFAIANGASAQKVFAYSDGNGATDVTATPVSVTPIDPTVTESAGSEVFTLKRYGNIADAATVYVSTTDGSTVSGESIDAGDFAALSYEPIGFTAGAATATASVKINNLGNTSGARKIFGFEVTDGTTATANVLAADQFTILDPTDGTDQGSQTITVTTGTNDATVKIIGTELDFPAERIGAGNHQLSSVIQYLGGNLLIANGVQGLVEASESWDMIYGSEFSPEPFAVAYLNSNTTQGTITVSDEFSTILSGQRVTADIPITISLGDAATAVKANIVATEDIYSLASPTLSIDGTAAGSYDFGIVHVGDTATIDVTITNAVTASLADSLLFDPNFFGSPFSSTGSLSILQPGASGTFTITLDTSQAGDFTGNIGNGLLFVASHDPYLPDVTLNTPGLFLDAEVDQYASPTFVENDSTGTIVQSGSNWTINLGKISYGSDGEGLDISVQNANQGAIDNLAGSFDLSSGNGFSVYGANPFTNGTNLGVGVDTTAVGENSETVTLHPLSQNSTGFSETLPDQTLIIMDDVVACFAAGTHITTARGEMLVEHLGGCELIQTHAAIFLPVTWLGHRHINCRRHPKPQDVWPVRISAGAFGAGMPRRDLFLSPDHAVFAHGVLIPIKYLINGGTIAQEPRDEVTYWHVELERHEVILAEGLPCESYLDTGNRNAFANGGGAVQLHPDFVCAGGEAIWEAAACAPLRIEGEAVARVVARLRRRAKVAGYCSAAGSRRQRKRRRAVQYDLARLLRPDWYLAHNPDVAAFGMDAATHYAGWGRAEGRLPCPAVELVRELGLIDPGLLIFSMEDVVRAGIDPVEHFCSVGWRERRRPNPYFDTGWYLDTHEVPDQMNPLLHYVLTGESVAPGRHFDPVWYRRRYALPASVSPLAHYLAHRRSQRVSPLPSFDVTAYVKDHADTLRPDRDPYMHYLVIGRFAAGTDRVDRGHANRAAA